MDTSMINETRFAILPEECRHRLDQIDQARANELSKPLRQRKHSLLMFIDKERAVYSFGLHLLDQVRMDDILSGKNG